MRGSYVEPAGLRYHPDMLTPAEHDRLLRWAAGLDYRAVVMHGTPAKRTTRHFGVGYDYDSAGARAEEPIPPELLPLRERCAHLAGRDPERFVEALVSRYPPGAGIGWHRDAPMFGSVVVGVSLAAPCVLRFQRTYRGDRQVHELAVLPRSVYVLSGAARASWQHSIPAVPELRYSVTFRTLRGAGSA